MLQFLLQLALGCGLTLFGFAWYPCCCGSSCVDPLVDCCASTYPTSFDITLPDDWTNPGGGLPCTNCVNIGGNTYTVTLAGIGGGCLLGSAGGSSIFWNYRGTAFCTIIANKPTCQSLSADLGVQIEFTCSSATECRMTVRVALGRVSFGETSCCSHWEWTTTFDPGTDCDTETWTLDYDAANSFQVGCCSDLFQCDLAGSPGQVTVVKT